MDPLKSEPAKPRPTNIDHPFSKKEDPPMRSKLSHNGSERQTWRHATDFARFAEQFHQRGRSGSGRTQSGRKPVVQ